MGAYPVYLFYIPGWLRPNWGKGIRERGIHLVFAGPVDARMCSACACVCLVWRRRWESWPGTTASRGVYQRGAIYYFSFYSSTFSLLSRQIGASSSWVVGSTYFIRRRAMGVGGQHHRAIPAGGSANHQCTTTRFRPGNRPSWFIEAAGGLVGKTEHVRRVQIPRSLSCVGCWWHVAGCRRRWKCSVVMC